MKDTIGGIILLCLLTGCDPNILTFAVNHSDQPVNLSFKSKEDLTHLYIIKADTILDEFRIKDWRVYGDSIMVLRANDSTFLAKLPPESTVFVYRYLRRMYDMKFDGQLLELTPVYVTNWGFHKKQVYNWPAEVPNKD